MACRLRSISRPIRSLLHSPAVGKSATSLRPSLSTSHPPPPFRRMPGVTGCLESMLPLHTAVSSARLTSRLGVDSAGGSRSLSQGTLCSSNPGV